VLFLSGHLYYIFYDVKIIARIFKILIASV